MFKIVILICSIGVAPLDCSPTTASDVIRGDAVATPMQCLFRGQGDIAPTTLVPEPGKTYEKVLCVRQFHVEGGHR